MSDPGDRGPSNQALRGAATKGKHQRKYKKPNFITRWLIVTLGFAAVIAFVALISDFAELGLLNRAVEGSAVTTEEATQNDDRQSGIALIQIVVFAITMWLFIAWTFRLYSNLEPLGATGLRRGRGWAIGGWFFPIVNLFMPKQILNDIWRASDPALEMNSAQWRDAPVPPVLTAWWIAFLLATAAGQAAGSLALEAVELEALRRSAMVFIAADALLLIEFVLAIVVVKKLTARQQERAMVVLAPSPSAVSGPVTA